MDEFEMFADSLLHAAPAVADALQKENEDQRPDMEMPTIWFGEVGRAVIAAFDELSETQRVNAFDLVEQYLNSGSSLMKDCIATGLLEAVANQVSRGTVAPHEIAALLGPRSRDYVDAWDQQTLGRSSLDPS